MIVEPSYVATYVKSPQKELSKSLVTVNSSWVNVYGLS